MSRDSVKASDCPPRIGFFGKVPSRGDFVRTGLSPGFVRAWGGWVRRALPGGERILGERWAAAWSIARPWRFALPAGACGTKPVLGLWLPSADRVGRPWPLVVAAEGATAGDPFLDAAELLGRELLEPGSNPGSVAVRLSALPCPSTACAAPAGWWSLSSGGGGAPDVLPGLPDAAVFARMVSP